MIKLDILSLKILYCSELHIQNCKALNHGKTYTITTGHVGKRKKETFTELKN